MANDLHTEPSLASLVGGVINDAQELMKQELALARREMSDELRKAREAAVSLGVGIGISVVGGFLLMFMLVYLLNWLTTDQLPLWACFGVIGGAATLLGVTLLLLGKSKAKRLHLMPPQTMETMKENLRWTKNPT
jgi:hypothetical protein